MQAGRRGQPRCASGPGPKPDREYAAHLQVACFAGRLQTAASAPGAATPPLVTAPVAPPGEPPPVRESEPAVNRPGNWSIHPVLVRNARAAGLLPGRPLRGRPPSRPRQVPDLRTGHSPASLALASEPAARLACPAAALARSPRTADSRRGIDQQPGFSCAPRRLRRPATARQRVPAPACASLKV